MRRTEVSPAFMGSLALHGLVLAALLISWRFSHQLTIGTAVPVTILANAPATDLRAAEQAEQEETAQTDAAPPAEVTPQPSPPEPAPTPQKSRTPPKPEKSLDLDALAASVSKAANTQTAKPSSAAKGPSRAETALEARPAAGSGLSAAAMNGLAAELQRRWNPNCEVEGGRDVLVQVTFELGAGGNVVGNVGSKIVSGGQGAVGRAAADRAVRAVYAAAPFRELPRQYYGERITVKFNAREACS